MTNGYSVRIMRSEDFSPEIMKWSYNMAHKLNETYSEFKYEDWRNFSLKAFADSDHGLVIYCFKNEQPVGALLATYSFSFFDRTSVLLKQNVLVAEPNTRATLLLMKEFIDIGRKTAKHTISCIGTKTNIKPKTLLKLGFVPMDTLFRLES